MNKHTPGPWNYQEWGRLILDSGQGSSQLQVATVALNTRRDEGTANAHLIAAAPDLLHAVQCLMGELMDLRGMEQSDNFLMGARALAKASGESA